MREERLHLIGRYTCLRGPHKDLRDREEGSDGENFVGAVEFRGGDEHYGQRRIEGVFGSELAEGC